MKIKSQLAKLGGLYLVFLEARHLDRIIQLDEDPEVSMFKTSMYLFEQLLMTLRLFEADDWIDLHRSKYLPHSGLGANA